MKELESYFEYLKPYQLCQETLSTCFIEAIQAARIEGYNSAIKDAVTLMEEQLKINKDGNKETSIS